MINCLDRISSSSPSSSPDGGCAVAVPTPTANARMKDGQSEFCSEARLVLLDEEAYVEEVFDGVDKAVRIHGEAKETHTGVSLLLEQLGDLEDLRGAFLAVGLLQVVLPQCTRGGSLGGCIIASPHHARPSLFGLRLEWTEHKVEGHCTSRYGTCRTAEFIPLPLFEILLVIRIIVGRAEGCGLTAEEARQTRHELVRIKGVGVELHLLGHACAHLGHGRERLGVEHALARRDDARVQLVRLVDELEQRTMRWEEVKSKVTDGSSAELCGERKRPECAFQLHARERVFSTSAKALVSAQPGSRARWCEIAPPPDTLCQLDTTRSVQAFHIARVIKKAGAD
ncbi:hypothetical protein L1887_57928 [Cichorium endivia]|nr:hypothetical protein L1887_57928 [Cichorium endivia]